MKKDRHQAEYIPFRCSVETKDAIDKLSIGQGMTKSDTMRWIVEEGLKAVGYKQDEEYLGTLVREAVASTMKPHVERLASISAKAAQISGAAFFMSYYMGQLMLPEREKQLAHDAAADARKLGIDFLKLKDQDMDAFIQGGVAKVTDKE